MIDSKKLVEELENATEWTARDYYQECHSAARLIRKLEAENAALKKRVAEMEMQLDCGQDGVCAARAPGCNRHWEERNRELVTEVRGLQSQLAWTPVSDGLPTEPGLYLFNNRGSVSLFTVGDDGTFLQHLDEDNEQWDAAPMSYWREYRRIELPKEGET